MVSTSLAWATASKDTRSILRRSNSQRHLRPHSQWSSAEPRMVWNLTWKPLYNTKLTNLKSSRSTHNMETRKRQFLPESSSMSSVMFLHFTIPMSSSRKGLKYKPRWRMHLWQELEKQLTILLTSSNCVQSLFHQLLKLKLEIPKSRSKIFSRHNLNSSESKSSSPPKLPWPERP